MYAVNVSLSVNFSVRMYIVHAQNVELENWKSHMCFVFVFFAAPTDQRKRTGRSICIFKCESKYIRFSLVHRWNFVFSSRFFASLHSERRWLRRARRGNENAYEWTTVQRTRTQIQKEASHTQKKIEWNAKVIKCHEYFIRSVAVYSYGFHRCCRGFRRICFYLPYQLWALRRTRVCVYVCVLAVLPEWKCLYYLRCADSLFFLSPLTLTIAARRCLPTSTRIICIWLYLRAATHRRCVCVCACRSHSFHTKRRITCEYSKIS